MLGLKEAIRAREGRFWPLSLKNFRVLLSLQGPESDAEGPETLTRVTLKGWKESCYPGLT